MEEDNKGEQSRRYLTIDESMERIQESRRLLRIEIKRIMEEETGKTYEIEDDLFAIFHTYTPEQQQTINGKISLLQKFADEK